LTIKFWFRINSKKTPWKYRNYCIIYLWHAFLRSILVLLMLTWHLVQSAKIAWADSHIS
jgi:hypothetical protein